MRKKQNDFVNMYDDRREHFLIIYCQRTEPFEVLRKMSLG